MAVSGPFSQLLWLPSISWRIDPPFLVDHDGCSDGLTMVDSNVLDPPLYDAWLRFVASIVTKRKTIMMDLTGLDPALLALDVHRLDSLQRSLLDALRSGALMDRAAPSRFDLTKMTDCQAALPLGCF